MSLLELRHVCKHRTRGEHRAAVLEDASLSIEAGELVAVWGMRGSGRTTFLRLAAGIDVPDAGQVRFDGRDLAAHGEEIIGRQIGYCQKSFHTVGAQAAIDEILVGLLILGTPPAEARVRAHETLALVGGDRFAAHPFRELDSAERVRLAIARALAPRPRLLVIDEPVAGVELHERDGVLLLLRALADAGVAVLMTVGEPTGLSGADRSLTIGDGELCASAKAELAPVLPLRPAARLRASG